MPFYLIIPLVCAVVYTLHSLAAKRGYAEGAGAMESFHWANVLAMPFFLPLFFIRPEALPLADLWRPALTSALIYIGSWSTFAAIRAGDVSLVTPILGTKVTFVALAGVLITGTPLTGAIWAAALLSTAGVFVTGWADRGNAGVSVTAILLCLGSALFFGLTDVLIGMWATPHGGMTFLAAIPQFIGLYSLIAIPFTAPKTWQLRGTARRWVIFSSYLLAAQGMAMGIALAFFSDPAGVNVVYSTRGLWSIVLVWAVGSWFGNAERHSAGTRVMIFRLTGALLILASVVIAVLERSKG